ncbi:MAG: prolipoprotein diacylglyceryl transferase [Anaerolineaceae bacterium]|nr:prolipoprotein diacylglyceryl transferase [Anaerolineaceae bacterium]
MFPILQVGPLSIQSSALVLLVSAWIAVSLIERTASTFELRPELVMKLVFISIVAGLIGGRLLYALQYSSVFISHPLSILLPTPTMFHGPGGFVIGTLTGLIYLQNKGMPLWRVLDTFSGGLTVFLIGTGISHLASGSYFGVPSTLPWALELWGETRQPTQIFEIIGAVLVCWAVWVKLKNFRRGNRSWQDGELFLYFLALSSLSYVLVDGLRADTDWLWGSFRAGQAAAWLLLAASLYGLGRREGILPNKQQT